jgi:hypothetical protein
VEIEFKGSWAVSASPTDTGHLIVYSLSEGDLIYLVKMEVENIKGQVSSYLKKSLPLPQPIYPLKAIKLRANLSSNWGTLLTTHLLKVHEYQNRDATDVVDYTAWRYKTLTDWGEASAARELAVEMNISVNTIRTRLQLARERGILPAPGQGARFGR